MSAIKIITQVGIAVGTVIAHEKVSNKITKAREDEKISANTADNLSLAAFVTGFVVVCNSGSIASGIIGKFTKTATEAVVENVL